MTSVERTLQHENDWQQIEAVRCLVCLEKVGTYGGVASLACGHRGCVDCLQQVQTRTIFVRCPICQVPIEHKTNHGTSQDLEGTVEFEWTGSPSFDDDTSEFGATDSQQKEMKLNHKEPEQCFRPCVYDEFNTWTPGSYPHEGVDTAANLCTRWPSVDNTATYVNGKPNVNANISSGSQILCSISLPTSVNPGCLDASRNQDFLSMALDDTWASVHAPSAPPFPGNSRDSNSVLRSVLDAEPPQWIPDSARNSCMQCRAKFQPLTRARHHCRFCGGIFCKSCSKGKCLLPLKFMQRDPQRVCDACYESLEPVQGFLIGVNSNASQIAVHDVTDLTCMRGWLNSPFGLAMQDEIYKATNTLRNFCKVGTVKAEHRIPEAVLRGAKGLAILTVVKVGMILTYKVGTGLLVARRKDGSWSPPAAIMSCGLGWGLQAGGEIVDFIIVLRSTKAVRAFSGRVHVSVGAGISASVGPLGRLAEADVRVGERGATACYTYSCSQGAFAGVSFEGNVVTSRTEMNTRFYGDMYVTPEYILFGAIPSPKAAAPLYSALGDLFLTMGA
ncbi:hypothetical protein GOP47_0030087 [Adiantum capillus-veneris]|nr:hypothetical protein GOP47_0030087 [Adiantum capillus-veneris]